MSQDYSRIRFDPGQDYLGVLLQQGRPLMDADWNALVAQLVRRTHAGSFDTFGPAVVPAQTPDGFLITPVAGGFTIDRGRIYVDGVLAENHGSGDRVWDPHLAEEYRPDPVAWDAQPYLPNPDAPPVAPYLVYVDVWQREITELQDTDLVDVAVGVDTTQRLQTVWQVRTLGGLAEDTDCETPLEEIPGWDDITAPSQGRLTTATGEVPGDPDPCNVPPLGGYKGGENQLYRVEVHDPGPLGTATFKWSRDNGSIQSRIQRIPDLSHLVLDWTEKDDVLRFDDGDWIEIIDDVLELNGEPGILRKIATGGGVDDATRTLTLESPLPAGQFPVDGNDVPTGNRNTRVRKWDQAGMIRRADGSDYQDLDAGGGTGAITIPDPAEPLLLENGILVTPDVATAVGEFHTGDWWAFAARSDDASLEILDAEPPRGIHHHYAKLAVVISDEEADDCREIWPPDRGCCTFIVRPGESIQGAIDALPDEGGCICLKSGIHEIDEPIAISRSNVTMHGESRGARVVGTDTEQLLVISGSPVAENIEIASISFEYANVPSGVSFPALLMILDAQRVHIHDCALRFTSPALLQIIGIYTFNSSELRIHGNLFERCYWGAYVDSSSTEVSISDNTLYGALYELDTSSFPFSAFGVYIWTGASAEVHGNYFEDFLTAVQAVSAQASITDNTVTRRLLPEGLDNPESYGDLLYAFVLAGTERTRLNGNRVDLTSRSYGGVMVTGEGDEITNNRFTCSVEDPTINGPVGIFAGDFSGDPSGAGDHVSLSQNHFEGKQLAVVMNNPEGVVISDNRVTGEEREAVGVMLFNCVGAVISRNTIREVALSIGLSNGRDNQLLDNTSTAMQAAALLNSERGLEIDGCSFDDASSLGVLAVDISGRMRFANSRIVNCGYEATSLASSFAVLQTEVLGLADLDVEASEMLATGISPDGGAETSGLAFGAMSVSVSHVKFSDNRISYALGTGPGIDREHLALLLVGVPSQTFVLASGRFEFSYGAALVTSNVFEGPSELRLVDARRVELTDNVDIRFEKLTFANNRCDHLCSGNDLVRTADLFGSHMVVNGNQVKTYPNGASIGLGNRARVALIGNYTTHGYANVNTVVPTPLTDFNVIV